IETHPGIHTRAHYDVLYNDVAKLYAEKCIRKKNEKINYLNLSNKLDILVSRLEGAYRSASVSFQIFFIKQTRTKMGIEESLKGERTFKDVGVMIPLIQKINAETNAIKIGNDVMKLENIFDEISISSELINDTVQTSSAVIAPTEEVNELISKIADEHAIQLDGQLGPVSSINKHLEEISNMSERIKNLK
ncbi:vacuolar protein sorting-associated protein 46, putative, partial [Plasmodium ovale curtisi]